MVSKLQEDAVKKYISGQHEHHQKEDFNTELLRFLRVNEIEFDEKYLFDSAVARDYASSALRGGMVNVGVHGLRFAPPVATFAGPIRGQRRFTMP
jgi:hypothetical protein